MLIEFLVQNFKSIHSEQKLDLVASSGRSLPNNICETKLKQTPRLLKLSAIYGKNASGKSNVLEAINLFKMLVISSDKNNVDDELQCNPFKLNSKGISEPTKFEICFIMNKKEYRYILKYSSKKVHEEKLIVYTSTGTENMIFHRKNDAYEFGTLHKDQDFISKRTPENVLYLSRSSALKFDISREVFSWFKEKIFSFGAPEIPPFTTIDLLNKNDSMKKKVLTALKNADLDIDDVVGEMKNIELDDLPHESWKYLLDEKRGKLTRPDVKSYHRIGDKNSEQLVEFDFFKDESKGTNRFFNVIGPIYNALEEGKTLVIDEFDAELHHLLQIHLLKLFIDPTVNTKGAQLIFTSQNVVLLDENLLRPDQIWIVEKNNQKSSEIYSLYDFENRTDRKFLKKYLTGRYGGIPTTINEVML